MPLLRSGRHPHEVFLLVVCFPYGIGGLISGSESRALETTFPQWAKYLWFVGLIMGSIVGVYGIYRNDITGLLIERMALRELTLLSALYIGVAIFSAPSTVSTALGISILLGFVISNIVRSIQIRNDLKNLPKSIEVNTLINGGEK